jgi:hypothetical protein
MHTSLYDLVAAETHWHDLQAEAEQERLARAAVLYRRETGHRSVLARALDAFKRRGSDSPARDAHKN